MVDLPNLINLLSGPILPKPTLISPQALMAEKTVSRLEAELSLVAEERDELRTRVRDLVEAVRVQQDSLDRLYDRLGGKAAGKRCVFSRSLRMFVCSFRDGIYSLEFVSISEV